MNNIQNINLEHPDYVARKAMWRKYKDLYAGGEQIRNNAADYLARRLKEPHDVYSERLANVFYENYAGSIIDWYSATLFRREPQLHIDGANESGRRFFNVFAEDCDLRGTSLTDFFRKCFLDTLVFGSSYILVDFPRLAGQATSRAEEEAAGAARAYLVQYLPENLINWSLDSHGNFEWVVLRTKFIRKPDIGDSKWTEETTWSYYDQTQYRIYRSTTTEAHEPVVELVDQGLHSMAKQRRVPLVDLKVSEGLWLMNKAGLLQLEHFNKSNALSWALTMGLFAAPVIYSERDFDQIVGESYYIQLGPQDRFGWTEPEGKVYQIAANNLARLQEEIYRVCYLLSQGGSTQSGTAQSGLSKLRDFAITQEVLRAYGDAVKDAIKKVLGFIEAAREDGLDVDVSGLDDFDIRDFSSDLEDAEKLLSLGMTSNTLKKQVFKKLAYKYLCDVRQDVKDRIAREIEAGVEAE